MNITAKQGNKQTITLTEIECKHVNTAKHKHSNNTGINYESFGQKIVMRNLLAYHCSFSFFSQVLFFPSNSFANDFHQYGNEGLCSYKCFGSPLTPCCDGLVSIRNL